jgi:hypothetical protein
MTKRDHQEIRACEALKQQDPSAYAQFLGELEDYLHALTEQLTKVAEHVGDARRIE